MQRTYFTYSEKYYTAVRSESISKFEIQMHGTAVLTKFSPQFDPRIPLKYQIDIYIRNSVEILDSRRVYNIIRIHSERGNRSRKSNNLKIFQKFKILGFIEFMPII